ncbi:hypothetical protein N658DRAFT_533187, partial [Parathielavia hyrcaniae]
LGGQCYRSQGSFVQSCLYLQCFDANPTALPSPPCLRIPEMKSIQLLDNYREILQDKHFSKTHKTLSRLLAWPLSPSSPPPWPSWFTAKLPPNRRDTEAQIQADFAALINGDSLRFHPWVYTLERMTVFRLPPGMIKDLISVNARTTRPRMLAPRTMRSTLTPRSRDMRLHWDDVDHDDEWSVISDFWI